MFLAGTSAEKGVGTTGEHHSKLVNRLLIKLNVLIVQICSKLSPCTKERLGLHSTSVQQNVMKYSFELSYLPELFYHTSVFSFRSNTFEKTGI